jgi:hypothetical protein
MRCAGSFLAQPPRYYSGEIQERLPDCKELELEADRERDLKTPD